MDCRAGQLENLVPSFTDETNFANCTDMGRDGKLVGRGELAAAADVPENAVIFWISSGLIKSVDLGERRHRRFDEGEVKIATLLGWARQVGLTQRAMAVLVAYLRESLAALAALPPAPCMSEVVTAASWRRADSSFLYRFDGFAAERQNYGLDDNQVAALMAAYEAMPDDREYQDKVLTAIDFIEGEGTLILYLDEQREWHADRRIPDSGYLQGPALFAFDLSKIFKRPAVAE